MFTSLPSGFFTILVGLVLIGVAATSATLVGAEGPIPTAEVVNQHIGQGNTEGLAGPVYQPNAGQHLLASTVAQLAGNAASQTPAGDPDPQIAVEANMIVTNEYVTTPVQVIEDTVYNQVMEELDVPQVTQPHASLPESSDDVPTDGCPEGSFGILCRLFN